MEEPRQSGASREGRWRRLPLPRAFSSAADERRARRPTDVLLLVASVLGLLLLSRHAPGPTSVDESLVSLLAGLPGAAGWVWRACFALITLWGLALILLAAASPGRRRLLGDYALAIGLSFVAALGASLAGGTTFAQSMHDLTTPSAPPDYLGLRVALGTAVVITASPHLGHWLRFVGRGLILAGAVAGVVLGVDLPIGATAGFLVGVGSAALTHLLLGSPGGRPTREAVARGLADLGLEVARVSDSPLQLTGSVAFRAEGDPRGPLAVKAYGRDAWDGQLLTSTWNAVVRAGEVPQVGTGRLPRAEHEALVCVVAERAGVPVLPLVAVGLTEEQDVLVVTHAPGDRLLQPELDEAGLAEAWGALDALHAAGLAHGAISDLTVVRDGSGRVALADFAAARYAAEPRAQRVDRARLVVASALAVGPERALAGALAALGPERFGEVVPFLQPAALDHAARRAVRGQTWGMRDLVRDASVLLQTEPPARERLARTSWGGIIKLAIIGLFAYWLIGFVSGVDWSAVGQAFRSADPAPLLAGLALSPTVQVWFALGTLGATLVTLRFLPVLMLQYGIQFIALIVPSSAARVALEVRFFTGWGLGPGPAMSVGVIDSVMGFVVQMVLVAVILLTGVVALTPPAPADPSSSSSSADGGPGLLAVLVGLLVVALVASALFPSSRRQLRSLAPRVVDSVRSQLIEARGSLTVLRRPSHVGLMLLGNLGAQVTQAIVLGLCLAAFGQHESFAGLVLVNTFVSLFAGFMPVPGGMGVAEAGLTAGLQALGVPAEIAVSTAIVYRMLTFYLPPIWGSLAMRWLRRHEYV